MGKYLKGSKPNQKAENSKNGNGNNNANKQSNDVHHRNPDYIEGPRSNDVQQPPLDDWQECEPSVFTCANASEAFGTLKHSTTVAPYRDFFAVILGDFPTAVE